MALGIGPAVRVAKLMRHAIPILLRNPNEPAGRAVAASDAALDGLAQIVVLGTLLAVVVDLGRACRANTLDPAQGAVAVALGANGVASAQSQRQQGQGSNHFNPTHP